MLFFSYLQVCFCNSNLFSIFLYNNINLLFSLKLLNQITKIISQFLWITIPRFESSIRACAWKIIVKTIVSYGFDKETALYLLALES